MLFGWEVAKSMYVGECMCKTWAVCLVWTRVDDSIFCVQCDMLHSSMDKEKKYHTSNLFLDIIVSKTMHFDNYGSILGILADYKKRFRASLR